MVDNKLLPKLLQNLFEIFNDDECYDVIIEVGKDPNVEIFRAHTVILYYRSPYLRRILSTYNNGCIKLPNILPNTFQIILRYIYCGSLSLKQCDFLDIIQILDAANELGLRELITYLQYFLIENKANQMEQNFDLIYQISFENDSFLELQEYCTDLISKEPDKIFKSPNFPSIPEKLLVSLIQNDDLRMSGLQVWEHVLEWGLAQNPELPSDPDPTSLSKDNFITLKNTLKQCIPFIKFNHLSSKEFLENVLPYKKVLPKELYKNLLKNFLDSDYRPIKFDSWDINCDDWHKHPETSTWSTESTTETTTGRGDTVSTSCWGDTVPTGNWEATTTSAWVDEILDGEYFVNTENTDY